MDGPTLSQREQQILAGIEEGLRVDSELDRQLRTMRLYRVRHLGHVVRGEREIVMLVLMATAGLLLVAGVPAVRFTPIVLISGLILLVVAGATGLLGPLVASLRRRRASRTPGSTPGSWSEAA